jgi:hypothetical protein
MHKFRSMVVNGEKLRPSIESQNQLLGPVSKIKNDPRITRIGKFLRKTSIDELLQLFNALKGGMSLTGLVLFPPATMKGSARSGSWDDLECAHELPTSGRLAVEAALFLIVN